MSFIKNVSLAGSSKCNRQPPVLVADKNLPIWKMCAKNEKSFGPAMPSIFGLLDFERNPSTHKKVKRPKKPRSCRGFWGDKDVERAHHAEDRETIFKAILLYPNDVYHTSQIRTMRMLTTQFCYLLHLQNLL
jgi:hypothetical protein